MSKTYGLIGTIENDSLKQMVVKEVSAFLQIDYNVNSPYMDVYVLRPTEGKISTLDVNGYIDFIDNNSFNGNKKVGIIYDFQLLSISNQNKLLKTIEDNRDDAMQLFICSSENKIIKTILSRIITFNFSHNLKLDLMPDELNDDFYQDIICDERELKYIREAVERDLLKTIYHACHEGDFMKAYVLYTTNLKDLNHINVVLMMRIMFTSVYKLKNYALLKELIKFEEREVYQINKGLMLEVMFVKIHKEYIWTR